MHNLKSFYIFYCSFISYFFLDVSLSIVKKLIKFDF